jgi:hypothetical protein
MEVLFLILKKRQNSYKKSDKKATKGDKTPTIKIGCSKKATKHGVNFGLSLPTPDLRVLLLFRKFY